MQPPPNTIRPPSLRAPASWTNLPGWVTTYILNRTDLGRVQARDITTADVYDALCKLWRLPLAFSAPNLFELSHPPTVFIINAAPPHLAPLANEHVQVLEFLAANARAQPRRLAPEELPRVRPQDWLVLVCPVPPSLPEPKVLSHLRQMPPHARCRVVVFGDCTRMAEDPRHSTRRPGARTDESGAETSEAESQRAAAEARSREKRFADAGLRKAPGVGPRPPPRCVVAVQRLSMAEIWSYGAFVTLTSKAAMHGLDGLARFMNLLQTCTYDALQPRPGARRLAAWLSSHTYRILHPHAVIRPRVPAQRSIRATRAFNSLHTPDLTLPVLSRRTLDERARLLITTFSKEDALWSLSFTLERGLKIIKEKSYIYELESDSEIDTIIEISRRLSRLIWTFSHTIVIVSDDEMNCVDEIDDKGNHCQFMTFDRFFEFIKSDEFN